MVADCHFFCVGGGGGGGCFSVGEVADSGAWIFVIVWSYVVVGGLLLLVFGFRNVASCCWCLLCSLLLS